MTVGEVHKVDLFNLPFAAITQKEVVSQSLLRAQVGAGGYICFCNVHLAMEAQESSKLREVLQASTLLLADGMPLVWLSRQLHKNHGLPERIAGPTFTAELLLAPPQDIRIGFIGAASGVLNEIKKKYPHVAGIYAPPFRKYSPEHVKEDWSEFLKCLPDGKIPEWVFVGLGAPKQEFWMAEASRLSPKTLFFGVGAAFEFVSGHKTRAPGWMQDHGLEWLHRLIHEPRRLGKRYVQTNSSFMVKATGELIKKVFN